MAKQQEAFAVLEELGLSAEQKSVVDQVITANNHIGAVYGAAAYRFGMEDSVRLLKELGEIA